MPDPRLSEVLNPRLALQRRMQGEGEAEPYLPDTLRPPPRPAMPKSPQEQARSRAMLIEMLRRRDASLPSPQ